MLVDANCRRARSRSDTGPPRGRRSGCRPALEACRLLSSVAPGPKAEHHPVGMKAPASAIIRSGCRRHAPGGAELVLMPRQTSGSPSGHQYRIAHGDHEAVVTQVGAGLRECVLGGLPAIDGYDVAERAPDGRGQVLAPFPNRLAGGRYAFGGHTCQVALDEPETANAIHGMVRWLDWTEVSSTEHDVVLSCILRPQPGYAWELSLQVGYHLEADGLT